MPNTIHLITPAHENAITPYRAIVCLNKPEPFIRQKIREMLGGRCQIITPEYFMQIRYMDGIATYGEAYL